MAITVKGFQQLVMDQAAAIQASAANLMNFTKGSILRAIVEANASIIIWLESVALYILSRTRASTSVGPDLNSWYADFDFERLGAQKAAGYVTFSRVTYTDAGFIPVGAVVTTVDRSQKFTVIADPTNTAYSASLNGFTISAGVESLTVAVQAQTAGSAGNVAIGTVAVIWGSLPGIDMVLNSAAMSGGVDAEGDPAYRARFPLYMGSLYKSTEDAIKSAIANMGLGLQCTITECKQPDGTPRDSFFFVVVDDGTGTPSSATIAAARAAVRKTRALGIAWGVFSPTVVNVTVSVTLSIATGYDGPTVRGQVGTALSSFINTLPLGSSLPYARLSQVIFDASPGVTNVSGLLLNGGTGDVTATKQQVIKTNTVTVD